MSKVLGSVSGQVLQNLLSQKAGEDGSPNFKLNIKKKVNNINIISIDTQFGIKKGEVE